MPAEWTDHRRTWLAWPCRTELWGDHLAEAKRAYAAVAQAIAAFEPVTVVARPELTADASLHCGKGISVLPMAQDDSWIRDTGPSFVVHDDGRIAGVDWVFNGWGKVYEDYAQDAAMAATLLDHLGIERFASRIVLEGGAIHVDGDGTALLCESSVLEPERNPGLDRAAIERELSEMLGIDSVIWLEGSLTDDETKGHVDNLACFAGPGRVLTLDPATTSEDDRPALERNLEILKAAEDAKGRSLDIVLVPQPKAAPRADGRRLTRNYINCYPCNGAVIIPAFEDPADDIAHGLLAAAFPDRQIVAVNAGVLLEGGGGIHCVTLQQPAPAVSPDERPS